MGSKDRRKSTNASKVEVGEIDTRAPFQSVKDAVNLFGEGAFSGGKPSIKKAKPQSAERVLAKETHLHLAQKELNKLKDQLKNAEVTKAQALVELEKAKRTVDDLSQKLKSVCESKESATRATEAANNQAKQFEEANRDKSDGSDGGLKKDLKSAREQYFTALAELDAAKKELRQIRQDYDASSEAKSAALIQVAEAEHTAKANFDKTSELSKEITAIQESIGQVKLATLQAQKEQATSFAEKDVRKQSHKAILEESANKLLALKKEYDPELTRNLELQLAGTLSEIRSLQEKIANEKVSDLDSVKIVTSELDDAKESLHKVVEEESSLRSLLDSLKLELENVKKEHTELKVKEAETESIAMDLHTELRKSKTELEAAIAEEAKVRGASEDMITTLHQLSSESENERCEAEDMMKKVQELKKEAEATRFLLQEAEEKLRAAMDEAEVAKADEARALDQIKVLSEITNAARTSTSESGAQITLSREEFESLFRKVEESDKITELKVAAALAQVEAVKASENEALKKLEATQKDIEDMKVATEKALESASKAEAAKKAVEGELKRWREREQKKAVEAASRILAETEMNSQSSPQHYPVQNQNPPVNNGVRKLEKAKTSVRKKEQKKVLLHNFSGIFHKKRNQIEGGSPSYLPGEKPV